MRYCKCVKCAKIYSEKSYRKAMIEGDEPAVCWHCRSTPTMILMMKEEEKFRPCLSCDREFLTIAKIRTCPKCKGSAAEATYKEEHNEEVV